MKLSGLVCGEPLSKYEGLPVYYNHNYRMPQLGMVENGEIVMPNGELDKINPSLVRFIEEGKMYVVNGGYMKDGQEITNEISLTMSPLPNANASLVEIIKEN